MLKPIGIGPKVYISYSIFYYSTNTNVEFLYNLTLSQQVKSHQDSNLIFFCNSYIRFSQLNKLKVY